MNGGRMAGSPRYAVGKLREIVGELATGPGDARDRVFLAARRLLALQVGDFPPSLRESFDAIAEDLRARRKKGGGYRWTNRTAARIARQIYELFWDLDAPLDRKRDG